MIGLLIPHALIVHLTVNSRDILVQICRLNEHCAIILRKVHKQILYKSWPLQNLVAAVDMILDK